MLSSIFVLQLIAESMDFSLVIRRGGMRPNRCRLDVLPDLCWSEISRYLTTDDVCHSLLAAYPHLSDIMVGNVPVSAVRTDGLRGVREAMLALPREVEQLTLGRRPSNASHLDKCRQLMRSPSLHTLIVSDLTWLRGQKIPPGLRELQLTVDFKFVNRDIWVLYLGPAVPVPNNITTLAVLIPDDPDHCHYLGPPDCEYLVDSSACFKLFNGLEKVGFRPPPAEEFWATAPDSALSRLREVTLDFCGNPDEKFCASSFLKHSARFTNLVRLNLVDGCDILEEMVELDVVLPSLQVLSLKKCSPPRRAEHDWTRLPALFPSLFHLEVTEPCDYMFGMFTLVDELNALAELRVIKLDDVGLSLETCVRMAAKVFLRHPNEHISVWCRYSSGEVTETAAVFFDVLNRIPSYRVSTTPELVVGARSAHVFELVRESL
jgi:hypothetical protein